MNYYVVYCMNRYHGNENVRVIDIDILLANTLTTRLPNRNGINVQKCLPIIHTEIVSLTYKASATFQSKRHEFVRTFLFPISSRNDINDRSMIVQ